MATEEDFTPRVSDDNILLVRGSTLKKIFALIRRYRVKTPAGSGLSSTEEVSGTSLRALDTGGSGGGGLGPVVFAGTASGAVAYFLVNSDGTAYSSPPSGYPIANPD